MRAPGQNFSAKVKNKLGGIVGKVGGLVDGINQERNRPVRDAPLDAEDLTDRRQIEGVSPQAIESVGGEGHHLAAQNKADSVLQNILE